MNRIVENNVICLNYSELSKLSKEENMFINFFNKTTKEVFDDDIIIVYRHNKNIIRIFLNKKFVETTFSLCKYFNKNNAHIFKNTSDYYKFIINMINKYSEYNVDNYLPTFY